MKKTLAIALVLVMVVSCLSVIFASAEVESLTVHFTQEKETGITDSALVLWESDIVAETAKINWSTGIAVDANGTIVAIGKNMPNGTKVTVPEGGFGIAFHGGDGENTVAHEDLTAFVLDLAKAAGVANDDDTINGGVEHNVSSAGWTAVLNTEDGENGFGSVTLYKGAKPAAGGEESEEESKEESKEPEVIEVVEEIDVDGNLEDTGWKKATWNDNTLWQTANAPKPEGMTGKFAVRTDADKIYVATQITGAIAPNILSEYADAVKGGLTANGAQTSTYAQTQATSFRFWLRTNDTERYLVDVQYLGEELGWTPVRAIYPTGSTLTWDDLAKNVEFKAVYADGTVCAEIAINKAAFGVTGDFSMFVSYWDNYSELVDEENTDPYQVLHIVNENAATNDNGVITDYSGNEAVAPYFAFKDAEVKLGTYEETVEPEPEEPAEPSYEDTIKELLGDKIENADFELDLTASVEKNEEGKLILTAVLTVKNIGENVKMQALTATLKYDAERMELKNGLDSEKALDCVTKKPGVWENMCKAGEAGTINVSVVNASDSTTVLTAEDNVELTFIFELKGDYTEGAVWVVNGDASSIYIPDPEVDPDGELASYVGNGAYAVGKYVEETPSEPESSEPESSATAPTGDAGILVFAVLGILAVAGAATVIKVRH